MLASLRVDAPPDPFVLARALGDRPGLALLRADGGRVAYVACEPTEIARTLDPEPSLELTARPHGEIPRWIGLLPYEARRSLERGSRSDPRPPPEIEGPLWRRYPTVIKISNQVEIIGSDTHAREELRERLLRGLVSPPDAAPVRLALAVPPEPGAAHRARIARGLELIRAGEIYQVNLARRFELEVQGAPHRILEALVRDVPPPHALSLDWEELGVAMASPELFLGLVPGRRAFTRPIKGTRPRLSDPALDLELTRSLEADPKERAELAMVIDVERNDLGRLAVPGSVRLTAPPAVESHASVHHRAATVEATLLPDVSREALLLALLPSGSVTGAPKIRAMEVIAELEPVRRGLYTGAAGFVREDGGLELGMAIRTVTMRGGRGSYHSGGGIVADSDPAREVEETLWKAKALIELIGGGENWA